MTSSTRSAESVGATAWRSSSRSVAAAPSTSKTISPSRITRIARADAHELGELRGHHEHREPLLGEVGDHAVELRLRGHVHAARGLVEQEHAAVVQQPAREHHLLLVAAGELANDALGIVGHGVERAQMLMRRGALGAHVEKALLEAPEVRERHVLDLAPVEQQALGLAVLRRQPEAGRDRARRRGWGAGARHPGGPHPPPATRARRSGAAARCVPTPRARRGPPPHRRAPRGSRRAPRAGA